MIASTKAELLRNSTGGSYKAVKWSERTNKEWTKLGLNAGRGFSFNEGDTLTLEAVEDLSFRVKETQLQGKKVETLEVAAQINNKWAWIPVWALRKKVRLEEERTSQLLSTHDLYQSILREENDWTRIELIASKTFTVHVEKVETKDSRTGNSYEVSIYLLNEASPKKPRGRRA